MKLKIDDINLIYNESLGDYQNSIFVSLIDFYFNIYSNELVGVLPILTLNLMNDTQKYNIFNLSNWFLINITKVKKIAIPVIIFKDYKKSNPVIEPSANHCILIVLELESQLMMCYDHNFNNINDVKIEWYKGILESIELATRCIPILKNINWIFSYPISPFNGINDTGDCIIFVMRHIEGLIKSQNIQGMRFNLFDRIKYRKKIQELMRKFYF